MNAFMWLINMIMIFGQFRSEPCHANYSEDGVLTCSSRFGDKCYISKEVKMCLKEGHEYLTGEHVDKLKLNSEEINKKLRDKYRNPEIIMAVVLAIGGTALIVCAGLLAIELHTEAKKEHERLRIVNLDEIPRYVEPFN